MYKIPDTLQRDVFDFISNLLVSATWDYSLAQAFKVSNYDELLKGFHGVIY